MVPLVRAGKSKSCPTAFRAENQEPVRPMQWFQSFPRPIRLTLMWSREPLQPLRIRGWFLVAPSKKISTNSRLLSREPVTPLEPLKTIMSAHHPNDLFEERAAIAEDGAGAPRNWAESFARLDIAERPPDFTGKAWRQLIEDGGRFLDRWANEAARLGWSALDVFGVHPVAPSATYAAIGLVPLIRGGDVVAIRSDHATVRTPGGTLLTYLRRPQPGAIAVWKLVDTRTATHGATEEVENA